MRYPLKSPFPEGLSPVLIQVTCNDRAPIIIRRALDQHLLNEEQPENYELGQIISTGQSKWDNQMAASNGQEGDSGQLVAPKSSI